MDRACKYSDSFQNVLIETNLWLLARQINTHTQGCVCGTFLGSGALAEGTSGPSGLGFELATLRSSHGCPWSPPPVTMVCQFSGKSETLSAFFHGFHIIYFIIALFELIEHTVSFSQTIIKCVPQYFVNLSVTYVH